MQIPNFIEKYSSKPLLTAKKRLSIEKHLSGFIPPKTVILCFNYSAFDKITKKIKNIKISQFFGDLRKFSKYDVGIISKYGIGSPITAILVEELSFWGVKNIISIGMGGSLQNSIEIGDIVLVKKALRDEGTSFHYQPPSMFALSSDSLQIKLNKYFKEKKIKIHKGSIWTTDAIYRETEAEIIYYNSKNILAVDMESSALFTVASHCKIDSIALLFIGDKLFNQHWESVEKHSTISNKIFEFLVDFIEFLENEL